MLSGLLISWWGQAVEIETIDHPPASRRPFDSSLYQQERHRAAKLKETGAVLVFAGPAVWAAGWFLLGRSRNCHTETIGA
jgi:hypothetical protein